MCRAPLRHNDVTRGLDNRHAIRIQQLPVPFPALSELELEAALLVEDLDAVVVGVCHDYVVLSVDSHTRRFRELTFENSKFAKLAVVDHFLTFDLRFGRDGTNLMMHDRFIVEVADLGIAKTDTVVGMVAVLMMMVVMLRVVVLLILLLLNRMMRSLEGVRSLGLRDWARVGIVELLLLVLVAAVVATG